MSATSSLDAVEEDVTKNKKMTKTKIYQCATQDSPKFVRVVVLQLAAVRLPLVLADGLVDLRAAVGLDDALARAMSVVRALGHARRRVARE